MRKAIYENDTFRLGSDIQLNACVGENGLPGIHTYRIGYYEATIALIENVKEATYNVDGLIYPIVFSARHTLELCLKEQLYSLRNINSAAQGETFNSKIKTTHSIKALWDEYDILTKIDVRYEPYIRELKDYIIDFIEVDDAGAAFRYPFSVDDQRHLSDMGCINILIFEDRFRKLYRLGDALNL